MTSANDADFPLPPLVLVGDGQVELYQSEQALALAVEATDLPLFQAYDSRGMLLRLSGHSWQSGSVLGASLVQSGPVSVEVVQPRVFKPQELHDALLDW